MGLGVIPPGLATNPLLDAAPAINACLIDPLVSIVQIPAGAYGILSSIVVPAGKTLRGAGRDVTLISALAGFVALLTNGLIYAAPTTSGVTITDLRVDGAKLHAADDVRLSGFQMRGTRFMVERTISSNLTGYGHFSQGNVEYGTFMQSGVFRDCKNNNCQIAFEQMASDGVLLDNCIASDGDGDLIGTYFHPLSRSRNITYLNCYACGNAFVGCEIIANAEADVDRFTMINCTIEMLGRSRRSSRVARSAQPISN